MDLEEVQPDPYHNHIAVVVGQAGPAVEEPYILPVQDILRLEQIVEADLRKGSLVVAWNNTLYEQVNYLIFFRLCILLSWKHHCSEDIYKH